MKKFKQAFIVVFSLLICLLFVACTSQNAQQQSTTKSISTTTASTSENVQKITEKASNLTSKKAEKAEKSTTASTTKKEQKTSEKKAENVNATASTTGKKSKAEDKTTTEKKTTQAATTNAKNDLCTITIQCKEILNNMDDLKAGHKDFVPSNGYILNSYKVKIESDDTVYSVLKRACSEQGIKLTSQSTGYGVYIVGINNIDEKDCGQYSGWKYKVNGKLPPYSCGKYKIEGGESIEFFFALKP